MTSEAARISGDDRIVIERLRRLGITVDQIASKPLPAGAWGLIEGIVRHIGGKKCRWYAAASLYGRFLSVIDTGGTVDALAEQFAEGRALAPLMARPEMRELVLSAELPGSLNGWLAVVTRRTKLRQREKVEVATDLIGQFKDKLAARLSPAEVILSLGEPRTAAWRIRREKLRQRSWLWHVFRRSCQAALFLVAALLLAAAWLLYRFHAVQAVEPADLIAQFDAVASAIAREDRAWPHYAAGLERLEIRPRILGSGRLQPILDACVAGPQHPQWGKAVEFLVNNREAAEQFLEGGAKPRFGFIRRDPLNDGWLSKLWDGNVESVFRRSSSQELRLPEIQDSLYIRSILAGTAQQAVAESNWRLAIRSLRAMHGLGRQIWDEEKFDTARIIARHHSDAAIAALRNLLGAQLDSLGDSELLEVRNMLEDSLPDWKDELLASSRHLHREYLSELYSADGRFTRQGLDNVCRMASMQPQTGWLTELMGESRSGAGNRNEWKFQLVGACLVPLVAGREEMLRKMDELHDLYDADLEGPPSPDETSDRYEQELDRLRQSKLSQIRYLPLLFASQMDWFKAALTGRWQKLAERDTLTIVVAAELFRRRHGAWPEATGDLVPEFLKSAPLDPYDRRPLRLKIIDGRLIVYSAGLDRVDDTAGRMTEKLHQIDARDWQLFPPVKAAPDGEKP